MSIEHLVTMANDIGTFFQVERPSDAPAAIAEHLQRFWTPRMQRQICEHLRAGGCDLSEPVRAAVERLAQ